MIRAASSQIFRRASPRAYQGGWYVLRMRKEWASQTADEGRKDIPKQRPGLVVCRQSCPDDVQAIGTQECIKWNVVRRAGSDPSLPSRFFVPPSPACQPPFGNFTYPPSVKTRRLLLLLPRPRPRPRRRRGGGNPYMRCPWGSPSRSPRCTTSGSSSRKKRRYEEAPKGHTSHDRVWFLGTK
jgi:hypothetical protein